MSNKVFMYVFLTLIIGPNLPLDANIKFSSRSSVLEVLQGTRIYLKETDSIKGWSRESIVQVSGNITPFDWDPSWTGENIINYDITPPPNLPENQGHITLQEYYFELNKDLLLGPNRNLIVKSSDQSNYTYIEGNGYSIVLAEGFQNLIQVEPGHTLEIGNVIIRNYDEFGIYLPETATLRFLDSALEIIDNRTLSRPLNIAGIAIINGYGYTLNFEPGASINVETGQLEINNMVLQGIQEQNLRCMQNNANLTLQNCNLVLTDDYRFRDGGLIFLDSTISGFHTFSFESSISCSIQRSLLLDTGVTFSYSPPVARNDLIWTDTSSILYLNGCTLKTTSTGLCLTKAKIVVDGQNQAYNDGVTTLSGAFILGNGDPAYDVKLEILPGAKLDFASGVLIYKNAN